MKRQEIAISTDVSSRTTEIPPEGREGLPSRGTREVVGGGLTVTSGLVSCGALKKFSSGLYYFPRKTPFGEVPLDEDELLRAFLKDRRFLVTSPNSFNVLGLGTTQLYNETVVYNHKRHGRFKLRGRVFDF